MPHNITNQKALTNFESIVEKTWNRLVLSISKKIKNYNLSKTSYDIASEAISYALKNKNIDWNNFATAEKHLYYSAKKNSSWFIKKEVNKIQSSKVKYNLDSFNENKKGDLSSENLIISHYSYEEYSKNLEDDEFCPLDILHLINLTASFLKKVYQNATLIFTKAGNSTAFQPPLLPKNTKSQQPISIRLFAP